MVEETDGINMKWDDLSLTNILQSVHQYINEIAATFPKDKEIKELSWRITHKLLTLDTQLSTKDIDKELESFRIALVRLASG